MTTTKTDNANLAAKLELRRHFLRRYHGEASSAAPIRVLDCCQGSGVIWSTLAREFPIQSWGLDVKPKSGRLKVESERVLAAGGWTESVVDIDTYGLPWSHWLALLRVCGHPVTVFLTMGIVRMGGGGPLSDEAQAALGLTFGRLSLAPSLSSRLHDLALQHLLHWPSAHGLVLQEGLESVNEGNARYFGLRLDWPGRAGGAKASRPAGPGGAKAPRAAGPGGAKAPRAAGPGGADSMAEPGAGGPGGPEKTRKSSRK